MTFQNTKETKRYGRTDTHTHGRENSNPTTNKVCGGYKNNENIVTIINVVFGIRTYKAVLTDRAIDHYSVIYIYCAIK